MPRPKKAKPKCPTHSSGNYVIKKTIGHKIDNTPIRKAFYSSISKEDCEKQYDQWRIENEVANRTGEIILDKEYGFSEWATKWLTVYKKPKVSENTYKFTYKNTVEKHLIPYFKTTKLINIKNIDIQAFYAAKANMSESMLGKMRECLIAIFDTAIDNDLCYKNPAKKATFKSNAIKHVKNVYTSEQITVVELAATNKMNEVVLLLETGLRRGEILGLMASDIDFNNSILSVNRSIADSKISSDGTIVNPPKWNSYRDIPLSQTVVSILRKIVPTKGYIFPKANGKPQSPNTWSQKLKRFMEALPNDIPRLTAHELRHTFGTDLRRRGVDIYTIQKVMGHKDLKMTSELYVHNEVEELKKAMKI